eukprot:TRINITY_DN50371_c0_g1_i1.p1 TRINITY_DN50371_c0_g1~~TRINITY_DN50371_c0_g1_i1.p1  ORF type:complete len:761 (-),score=108.22 TRINITY_DN50371_c0_g1_i1:170-2452(-)
MGSGASTPAAAAAAASEALQATSVDDMVSVLQGLNKEERMKCLEAWKRLESLEDGRDDLPSGAGKKAASAADTTEVPLPDFMEDPAVPDGFSYGDGLRCITKNSGKPRQWIPLGASSPEVYKPQHHKYPPEHRLGISSEGVLEFCKIIGLVRQTEDGLFAFNDENPAVMNICELEPDGNPLYLDVDAFKAFAYVMWWLRSNGYGEMTLCQVVKSGEQFAHISHHVSDATVVIAGSESDNPLEFLYKLNNIPPHLAQHLPPEDNRFWWLSHFSIGMMVDLDVKQRHDILADVGCTVAMVSTRGLNARDKDDYSDIHTQLEDSHFCYDLAMAVLTGRRLVVMTNRAAADLDGAIREGRLNIEIEKAEFSTNGCPGTPQAIRNLVQQSGVGYVTLNKIVGAVLVGGGNPYCQIKFSPTGVQHAHESVEGASVNLVEELSKTTLGDLPGDLRCSYAIKEDGSHLRLGITQAGMVAFMKIIGMIERDERTGYLVYVRDGFQRDPEDDTWLSPQVGPIKFRTDDEHPCATRNVTGYDLCAQVRGWLMDFGKKHEAAAWMRFHENAKGKKKPVVSVVEAILLDPALAELRRFVGPANVFYSHMQRTDPLRDLWRLEHARPQHQSRLPPLEERFIWIDYLCLRQCVPDFDTLRVVALIKEAGLLLADLDDKLDYLQRTFCVLELFGAVHGNVEVLVQTNYSQKEMERERLAGDDGRPVRAQDAQTRSEEDKHKIDSFICSLDGGFDKFNEDITRTVIKNANPYKGMRL